MFRNYLIFSLLIFSLGLEAQTPLESLTVEKIMRDPKWVGSSPSNINWSVDGQTLYFEWNPTQSKDDSLYKITISQREPTKASLKEKANLSSSPYRYNADRTAYTYSKNGDIYYGKVGGDEEWIMHTSETESQPHFSHRDQRITFTVGNDIFTWEIETGRIAQLLNVVPSKENSSKKEEEDAQYTWLQNDQLKYFQVLRERKEKEEIIKKNNEKLSEFKDQIKVIPLDGKNIYNQTVSPNGRYLSYTLFDPEYGKSTIVPQYVTESGYTIDLKARPKVGSYSANSQLYLYNLQQDTIYEINIDSLPGIRTLPAYLDHYPERKDSLIKSNKVRQVTFSEPFWSPNGKIAIFDIKSNDNKNRWIAQLNPETGKLTSIDHQRDEAWIAGPGIGWRGNLGWIDDTTLFFQSEKTGYSHLYTYNTQTQKTHALTQGNYEVQKAELSNDKKQFFITTNRVHPGEKQFYHLNISTGQQKRITTMEGANLVEVSPDEKYIAILYSYSNKPWELYLQENKVGGKIEQITDKAQSAEFKSYPWRDPEIITFKASDGAKVYARIYKPDKPLPNKPAILFVHGAGYLQNAHKWWSHYFREYMFNNLLVDQGYYVMDVDYRGSAGYGRGWRTGIYRHMGGKDLSDHVDAVDYLVEKYGVNPDKIGIYGGSYGGFISLMALFTEPDVFAAGAALRPVTDWAQYNHGYTSNILNEPHTDSLAYRRSSPIYFAKGLEGHLLICHGMIDTNVHYQDAVKLAQRLIELGKENWELASYPMEGHGFTEPSSWTDEYKRILQLFEDVLKE